MWLPPLLRTQPSKSRSQQWALRDELAIWEGLIYIGSLPSWRGQRLVFTGTNTFWIWICLLQAPPSTYLDNALFSIVVPLTFLLAREISQWRNSNWLWIRNSMVLPHTPLFGSTYWSLNYGAHWEITPWNFMALRYRIQYTPWINNPRKTLFLP